MMQKIQKFGGAMFTPVLLFAFAGVVIGLGTLFTTEVIFGALAAPDTLWYGVWNVILQGGWTVFNQLPLLFAVSLPIGLANKQNARCCMEVLVAYLTFNYFVSTMLSQWGPTFGVDFSAETGGSSGLAMVASIKTLDMGMIGALAISGIVIALHNKLFDFELPEWLGVFSGSTFVYMIAFFVMLPTALLACLVWPHVQDGIRAFQGFVATVGLPGVWIFAFLERALIPFGLHHLLYSPFYYDNAVVNGGIYAAFAKQLPEIAASSAPLTELAPYAAFTCSTWSKMFGCPGIALAFYATAKPEKRQELLGLLIPIVGIGEKNAIIAIVLYGLMPMVRNTYTGITNISTDLIDAAVGMGSTKRQLLLRIKLPLATSVIIAGLRNLTVISIATGSIAAFIGGGGLGDAIFRGITMYNTEMIFAGSLLLVLLALVCDYGLSRIEKHIKKKWRVA